MTGTDISGHVSGWPSELSTPIIEGLPSEPGVVKHVIKGRYLESLAGASVVAVQLPRMP